MRKTPSQTRSRLLLAGVALGALVVASIFAPHPSEGQPLPRDGEATHSIDPRSFATVYEIQELDASSMRTQALLGALDITVSGNVYHFRVAPVQDLASGAMLTTTDAAGAVTQAVIPTPILIFEGTTSGGASGTFSLPGNWIMGEIRDGNETIYIEPHYSKGNRSGPVETIVYLRSDLLPASKSHDEQEAWITAADDNSTNPPNATAPAANAPTMAAAPSGSIRHQA
jgi:hypothetical protein